MRYGFGDVILVPFPFTDQSTKKQRPAVVISGSRYSTERPDLILLAITSQVRALQAFGEAPIADWRAAGLLKPSVFKPLITTIEQSLVIKRLGKLSSTDEVALRTLIEKILGWPAHSREAPARHAAGVVPDHRRKARVKALASA